MSNALPDVNVTQTGSIAPRVSSRRVVIAHLPTATTRPRPPHFPLPSPHRSPIPLILPIMAPASKSAKAKGQKPITSFFGKPKKAGESSAVTLDEKSDDKEEEPEEDSVDDDAEQEGDEDTGKGEKDLPPIHDIPRIFSDLVSRIPDIKGVAEHLKGRKMRVATMCSGTESPLLALDLITRCIREHFNVALEVEHVFSCEIEPFKQAYIERNFQPPFLFRDVCELGDDEA